MKRILTLHIPVSGPMRRIGRAFYAMHVGCREGTRFLLRVFWYEPLFRSQCERVGGRFMMEQLPYMEGNGRIIIGEGVRLSGRPAFVFGNRGGNVPTLTIGDNSFLGHGCYIYVASSVCIGRNCLIAGGTRIYDYDGHPVDAEERRRGLPTPATQIRPVVLGDDVWVGSETVILKGVTIGARAVIATRSVVTKDVPPDTMVAGNPARTVRLLTQNRDEAADPLFLSTADHARASAV